VFRAAINHQGPLWAARAIEAAVPAGETTVVEEEIDYYTRDGGRGEINFAVRWADGSESWTVDAG
jgi:hypothetical protein